MVRPEALKLISEGEINNSDVVLDLVKTLFFGFKRENMGGDLLRPEELRICSVEGAQHTLYIIAPADAINNGLVHILEESDPEKIIISANQGGPLGGSAALVFGNDLYLNFSTGGVVSDDVVKVIHYANTDGNGESSFGHMVMVQDENILSATVVSAEIDYIVAFVGCTAQVGKSRDTCHGFVAVTSYESA